MPHRRAVAWGRQVPHRGLIPRFHWTEGSGGDKSSDEAMLGKPQDIVDAVGRSREISKVEDELQLELGGCLRLPRVAQTHLLKQLCP